jgi:hypothetical protein
MKKLLLLSLFLVAPCYANGVPSWTTGSSNRTENTTQTITRTQVIAGGDAVFTVADSTKDWSLSITTRAASQMTEKITLNDAITTTSVITSLSVFSQ